MTNTINQPATMNVSSIQEAIENGYTYVIAWRDHYRGNSKGAVYGNLHAHADVHLNHYNMDDRGIHTMIATNINVIKLVELRRRILSLINRVEYSMSTYSPLFTGQRYQYLKYKMVFGTYRKIMGLVPVNPNGGASNFDSETFFGRHKKMLAFLKEKLKETNLVSSTFSIIN